MKLAEALLLRSDGQKKINDLVRRTEQNIWVQEEEAPTEDPQVLLKEIFEISQEVSEWIQKINQANNVNELEPSLTLSQALVQRDQLQKEVSILSTLLATANQGNQRMAHTEIKMTRALDAGFVRKEMDRKAKALRKLDTAIQAKNWTIDL